MSFNCVWYWFMNILFVLYIIFNFIIGADEI